MLCHVKRGFRMRCIGQIDPVLSNVPEVAFSKLQTFDHCIAAECILAVDERREINRDRPIRVASYAGKLILKNVAVNLAAKWS